MSPVTASSQVFDAMQKARTGSSAFCTNFFPVQWKLDGWIEHNELFAEIRDGASFFFRKERDFWHWYFCAADLAILRREMDNSTALKEKPMVVDLVGRNGTMDELFGAMEKAEFSRYRQLVRLARPAKSEDAQVAEDAAPTLAVPGDVPAILALLEAEFDVYADQLPSAYELEAAVVANQIFVIRKEEELAALLFFETQGVTSTVRYWVVGKRHRAHRFGSTLIRHYFASQKAVRRFVLWVRADNGDAVAKYLHYGYSTDGLIDQVLINKMVRA